MDTNLSKKVKSYFNFISNEQIDYLINLPEVIKAKTDIEIKDEGIIYFNIKLTSNIRDIFRNIDLDISNFESIPMRWIKGNTKPHIDIGSQEFNRTYLVYLTDSPGELIIDKISYPISKGNAYVFSEGLSHKTINTGLEPRLLLGPMSENGIPVGAATNIQADGENQVIYFKYINDPGGLGIGVFYKINNGNYNNFSLPVTITNTNTSYTLKVLFENDLVLDSDIWYFICGSDNIQFGSTSLNTDETRTVISIYNLSNYPGLIQNGTSFNLGFSNIYVFNLQVTAINGSTQPSDAGWIGQA